MDTPGYIKLNTVVHKYLDRSFQNTSKYRRLYAMAVDCLSEYNFDVAGIVKTCKLSVLANQTAELPMDFLQWSKVGVLNYKGEVACLQYNSNLTSYHESAVDRLETNTDGGVGQNFRPGNFFLFNNFYDGYGYVNLYGIPGSEFTKLGEFKIDKDKGLMLLGNGYCFDYVILEYLAAPDCNEEYEIPIQLQEAVIAWLGYKDIEFQAASRQVSQYDKQRRFKEYIRQKTLAKERMQPFRIQIANSYTRETIKMALKS